MKDRDLLACSLLRLGCDDRPEWMRSIAMRSNDRLPRRLIFYRKVGSVVAHPSASHASERAAEALALLAGSRYEKCNSY